MPVFRGCGVSIVTPFHNGAVDFTAFTRLIELQIASATDAIVVCDTAGEPDTLTVDEKLSVIQFVVERVNGRVPVISGAFGNSTSAVIEDGKAAEAIGVDALLVVAPYFNQTSTEGLIEHFQTIADSVTVPVIVYNTPARTGVNITPETMSEILKNKNIVGIKEASGNIEQIVNLASLCPDCDIYAGNDDHVVPVLSVGGCGVISTIANIMPDTMHAMCEAYFKSDTNAAREYQMQMIPLWRAAFSEVNPIAIKAMMGLMKLCDPDVRLQLVPLSAKNAKLVKDTLKAYQFI